MGDQPLTHLNTKGEAHIVDIGEKSITKRRAVAIAKLEAEAETVEAIFAASLKKGDALAVARIAGLMAAKKTSDLIPLCHPLSLTHMEITIERGTSTQEIVISAAAETTGRTGVEMEAMTAASVAALTLYDMAKGIDKNMHITSVALAEKQGGKSGHYRRPNL